MSVHELFGPIAANDNVSTRTSGAPEWTCEHCGKIFWRRRDSKNACRFCSRDCGYKAKSNVAWTSKLPTVSKEMRLLAKMHRVSCKVTRCLCRQCGSRFNAGSTVAELCSEPCRQKAQWERRGVDASPRKCPECDSLFQVTYGRGSARFCTDECSTRHNRRASKGRRRARLRSADNDNVNPFAIFDRDGWRCRLCGVKTPKKLRGTTDARAPELDHILPLSQGGTHTLDNVQCSCRKCNGAKGATPMGQMLLFG